MPTCTRNTRSRKRQRTAPLPGDSDIPGEQSDANIEEVIMSDPVPEQPTPQPESSSDSAEHRITADQSTPAEGAVEPPAPPVTNGQEATPMQTLRDNQSAANTLRGVAFDSAEALEKAGYYAETPRGKSSPVWTHLRRLTEKHPAFKSGKDNIFQCTWPKTAEQCRQAGKPESLKDGICGFKCSLTRVGNWFSTSNISRHNLTEHKAITDKSATIMVKDMDAVAAVVAHSTSESSSSNSKISITKSTSSLHQVDIVKSLRMQCDKDHQELIKARQMEYLVYSSTSPPLSVCRCPRFDALLKACWKKAKVTKEEAMKKRIQKEFLLFKILLYIELKVCSIYYCSPFAQIMHDGGTLKDRDKYQSLGLK